MEGVLRFPNCWEHHSKEIKRSVEGIYRIQGIALVNWLIFGYPNSKFLHPSNTWIVQEVDEGLGEGGACCFSVKMSSLITTPREVLLYWWITLVPWYHKKNIRFCNLILLHPYLLDILYHTARGGEAKACVPYDNPPFLGRKSQPWGTKGMDWTILWASTMNHLL